MSVRGNNSKTESGIFAAISQYINFNNFYYFHSVFFFLYIHSSSEYTRQRLHFTANILFKLICHWDHRTPFFLLFHISITTLVKVSLIVSEMFYVDIHDDDAKQLPPGDEKISRCLYSMRKLSWSKSMF